MAARKRMPRIVASGSRQAAYRDFCVEIRNGDRRAWLLVDSEAPVVVQSPWQHLPERDGWARPDGADDGCCHLMVQCMEAWLVADAAAMGAFFGKGFQASALPVREDVEQIGKPDLYDALKRATRSCRRQYVKGAVSFDALASVDPRKVGARSKTWARRFFDALSRT